MVEKDSFKFMTVLNLLLLFVKDVLDKVGETLIQQYPQHPQHKLAQQPQPLKQQPQ